MQHSFFNYKVKGNEKLDTNGVYSEVRLAWLLVMVAED